MKNTFPLWIATWFGAGYVPRAPGTAGALAALPLHWLLVRFAPGWEPACILLITLAGIWSAQRAHEILGEEDPQVVVVDEVAGVLMGLWVAGPFWGAQIVAFLAFRLFDIWKPWPISAMEHLDPPGLGIMADDLGAGLLAAIVTWLWLASGV